jgi:hypothetical protein
MSSQQTPVRKGRCLEVANACISFQLINRDFRRVLKLITQKPKTEKTMISHHPLNKSRDASLSLQSSIIFCRIRSYCRRSAARQSKVNGHVSEHLDDAGWRRKTKRQPRDSPRRKTRPAASVLRGHETESVQSRQFLGIDDGALCQRPITIFALRVTQSFKTKENVTFCF